MAESSYILGPAVREFEQAFAKYCEVGHCIGVGNGTDAIELAVRALDIGPGDEVLVPANTFIATALGVVRAGATPVLVDSDEFYLLDAGQIERKITPKTRAIMPVHLFGQMAAMNRICEIAKQKGLAVIEDAAQAQGARHHGKRAGSIGDFADPVWRHGGWLGRNLRCTEDFGVPVGALREFQK